MIRFKARPHNRYGKRHQPGVMSRDEVAYEAILAARKQAGEIIDYQYEPATFKLAKLCTYKPDFQVFLNDGSVEYIDVKGTGPIDDKSIVKIKCAAEKFFMFTFVMAVKQTKKNGGGWKRTEY